MLNLPSGSCHRPHNTFPSGHHRYSKARRSAEMPDPEDLASSKSISEQNSCKRNRLDDERYASSRVGMPLRLMIEIGGSACQYFPRIAIDNVAV